jgi:hypothetical protein
VSAQLSDNRGVHEGMQTTAIGAAYVAVLAQTLAERCQWLVRDEEVVGSNPATPTAVTQVRSPLRRALSCRPTRCVTTPAHCHGRHRRSDPSPPRRSGARAVADADRSTPSPSCQRAHRDRHVIDRHALSGERRDKAVPKPVPIRAGADLGTFLPLCLVPTHASHVCPDILDRSPDN